jgi:hypothetical protein
MKIFLSIPRPLVMYAEWHQVEPEEYVQFILEEKGREVAYWLIEEARRSDSRARAGRPAPQGLS